jgi:outer membrane protein
MRRDTFGVISGLLLLAAVTPTVRLWAAADPSAWQASAGGGALVRPRFPGSDSLEIWPLPFIDAIYEARWFLRSDSGLGGYLWRNPSWTMSLSVAPDLLRRRTRDDARLQGLGDVSETAEGLLRTVYSMAQVQASLALASDIAGKGHGTSADFAVEVHQSLGERWRLRAGGGATWNNAEFFQTFFGVNQTQSERSGLPTYRPAGGVSAARLFAGSSVAVTPHWRVESEMQVGYWLARAADSPITERKGFERISVFAAYTF